MADIVFSNGTETNLRDISGVNIPDASASAYVFTGDVGVDLATDGTVQPVDMSASPGQCTVVDSAGQGTYVAFKLSDGVSLALLAAP